MLNRYGLFDIDGWMKEQAVPNPTEAPPPPPPPGSDEDPDEKRDEQNTEADSQDLVDFRRKHATTIYEISSGRGDRQSRNATMRELHGDFAETGIDRPFIVVFDQKTTGLKGPKHIALLAKLHGGGANNGGAEFQTPGAASEFADSLNSLYDDLEFEVGEDEPTRVTYKKADQQPEEEPEQEEQKPQAPMQPLEQPPGPPVGGPAPA